MGWLVFWVAVVVVLTALWFAPRLRDRRPSGIGPGGRREGPSEHALREAERFRGFSGGGPGTGA